MIRLSVCVSVFLVACAAISGPAQAESEYHSYGSGNLSCGQWLANSSDAKSSDAMVRTIETNWVLGWVSAAGAYNVRGDLRHTDRDAIAAWVDKYCREHPLDNVSKAAEQLVEALAKPE